MSATFFGSDNHDGSGMITGITATYNQMEASGIVAVGLDPYLVYNNLYHDSGYAPPLAVDYYGIVFAVTGVGQVNLCGCTAGAAAGGPARRLGVHSLEWQWLRITQISQSSFGPVIPEPATLALFGGGLVAAGAVARRRLWGLMSFLEGAAISLMYFETGAR